MYRAISFVFCIGLFVLTACSHDPAKTTPKEKSPTETADQATIITKDGKVTFIIFNYANVPSYKVDSIKQELLEAYDHITEIIKTDYQPAEKIQVFLRGGREVSTGFRSALTLYSIREDKYPLVHELTHTLLGYGDQFDTNNGYVTQEGFAIFTENMFGKPYYPNFDVPIHKVMKYLVDANKNIPLSKLTNTDGDDPLFRPGLTKLEDYSLQWMSYLQSGSFVTYLIDSYGLEKFEQIYNISDLPSMLEKVYDKNLEQLEKEWLKHVSREYNELTSEDKMKIDNFYSLSDGVDSIDKSVFARK